MFHGHSNEFDSLPSDEYMALEDTVLPDDVQVPLLSLPPLTRQFYIPLLTDKPQNPIMSTLQHQESKSASLLFEHPQEVGSPVVEPLLYSRPKISAHDFWKDVMTRDLGRRDKVLSWDRLGHSHTRQASSTGFLSEQDDLVFAAARYCVKLHLWDPEIETMYVSQSNILNALKMIVVGIPSVYHTWNVGVERFEQAGVADKRTRQILIDGKDEVVSRSFISRFITIGTLLRRLETLLTSLRVRSAQDGPTVHAYAHVLATIIAHLRLSLAGCPPVNDPLSPQSALTAIWMHYEIYEETLVALAELYGRDEQKTPEEYPIFDPSPIALLSSIYIHLQRHIERQSPRTIIAIFAFMLTHVSHDYLQQISQSVGYGRDPVKNASRSTGNHLNKNYLGDEDEDETREEDIFDILERVEEIFPQFFPRKLLDILPAAQKSLILLERARPDHPMLQHTLKQRPIHWFWTESLIEAACEGHYPYFPDEMDGNVDDSPLAVKHPMDNQELAMFRIFDQAPGVYPAISTALAKAQTLTRTLQSFIDIFPATLPSITPTLSHLTSLVLAPLLDHASALSSALLALYLTPSLAGQDTLSFEAHLTLLRSYLLVTFPPFKARLAAALFSDNAAGDTDNKAHGLAIQSLRHKPSSRKIKEQQQQQPWAVGLASSLLERETWPPVGSDLSFFLRTVIVDSIDSRCSGNFEEYGQCEKVKSRVLEEAEYRLGFAIKDLPIGYGRDKWLNPLSIEALDFLYMDYKPPTALEVLITPDILSKYQRLFGFILRLMRVEHAVVSLFRMTRAIAQPLFPTLTQSRKALFHFRFVAQTYVSSLSAYVFDTAISGNFDPFLTCLSVPGNNENRNETNSSFSDVFALAKSHSALLDDILTACLLRSSQRAIGDVLRSTMELILEFTVSVGQLHRGRVEEYEAAMALEDISKKFFSRMATLTKVLRGLADKNGLSERTMLSQGLLHGVEMPREPTGGTDALYHLLIRLDLGEFWSASR